MVFGFLKDKLKKVAEVFTRATTKEEPVPEVTEDTKVAKPVKPVKDTKPAKPAAKPEPKKVEKPAATRAPTKPETKKTEPAHAAPKPVITATTPAPVHTPAAKQSAADLLDDIGFADEEDEPIVTEPIVEQSRVEERKHDPEQKHAATKAEPVKAEQGTQSVPAPGSSASREPVLKVEQKEEKLGFFGKLKAAITSKQISREEFDALFEEIEIDLLENNVALDVVDKIREDLWTGISTERLSRVSPEKRVAEALKQSLSELFIEPFDILADAKKHGAGNPYIICAVGINGSGKTTTLAKLGKYFEDHKLPVVFAAGDTFRAAAIQQLEEHATRLKIPIIKQQYGADPAAVAFDAIAHAKAHGQRVVLIDTAGRLHSNTNLMAELEKVVRVAKPHCTIFIGEATTGNDCVDQAVEFQKAVKLDGIVLSKVDVDERGGAALSISYVTRKPILFFGTGQRYEDLEPFDKKKVLASLEL